MTYVLNGFKPLQPGSKKTVEDLSGRRVPVSEVEKRALAGEWRVFDCDMHDLRHTFATMLFESGIEPNSPHGGAQKEDPVYADGLPG